MKRNSTQLKNRMAGKWLSAFHALAPSLRDAIEHLGESVPCPREGGVDGFRLFRDANDTGGGVKHAERVIPEGIDMLMWVNTWTFPQAYDELESWLNGSTSIAPAYVVTPKPKVIDETNLRKWLNDIWKEAHGLDHLLAYPARAYFGSRRMLKAALAAKDIRYHPKLNYRDKKGNILGEYGAILSLACNNNGQPVGIHRTFITSSGLKVKFNGPHKAKKMSPTVLKNTSGRHFRLFAPQQGILGTAEGLETALAVFEAKQFPVWPSLSNTTLESFVPPLGVHTILNFVDKDRSKVGEDTHVILSERLTPKGIRVIDLLPPTPILDSDEKGVDWADQLIRDPRGFDVIDDTLSQILQVSA